MKIRELLLELREVIDRHGNYGQWVDSISKKAYPINRMFGHFGFVRDNTDLFSQRLNKNLSPDDVNDDNYYEIAYESGLVRVEHDRPQVVDFDGKGEALKRIIPIIMATARQEDVQSIGVNVWDGSEYMKEFSVPTQARELQMFLSSL